jgi:hypothetical protein
MDKVKNPQLYQAVKNYINSVYEKPSAYRSMAYFKMYRDMGGEFKDELPKDLDKAPLKRWELEKWGNVPENKEGYPVYRPFKRITAETPITYGELDKKQLKEQIARKQEIKDKSNLPPFRKK